jgi:serine/threonine protein kinase
VAKHGSTASFRSGARLGAWTLTRRLGQGGNGQVWEARGEDGTHRAIKLLNPGKGSGRYRLARFRDEVRFLTEHPGRPGVLPLVDSHLSDHPAGASWYVMPTATPIREALGNDPRPEAVVGAVAAVAETLAALAAEGIGHRDVKPDNLFQLDEEWVVGDFGLVTYPEKDPLTEHGRRLGPVDFMAPEMRQDADHAHAEAADVWALAKTLWALLLNQAYPLPGPHRPTDPAYALHHHSTYARARELDLLLEHATAIDPAARETMTSFARELRACLAPPPEATASANLQALQDRITTLTTVPHQQLSDAQEQRRRVNKAFEQLKEHGLSHAYHALARRLVHFQSRYHDDVTDALAVLDRKGLSYAGYTWGGQLSSPTSTPRVVVTIAVAARVMQEHSPAEFADILTVERRQDHRADVHELWRGSYAAPIASAQQACTSSTRTPSRSGSSRSAAPSTCSPASPASSAAAAW